MRHRRDSACIDKPHVHCDVCDKAVECEPNTYDKDAPGEPVVPAIVLMGYYWKEVMDVPPALVTLCAECGLPIMEHLSHVLPTPPPPAHTLN